MSTGAPFDPHDLRQVEEDVDEVDTRNFSHARLIAMFKKFSGGERKLDPEAVLVNFSRFKRFYSWNLPLSP